MGALSESQIVKLSGVFAAALGRLEAPDAEACNLIEQHWGDLEPELVSAFASALNKVLARAHAKVRLSVTGKKDFQVPEWMSRLSKDAAVTPGNYGYWFEDLFRGDEAITGGDAMLSRAEAAGPVAGLVHALWLLEHQQLIPEKLCQNTLVFSGAEGIDRNSLRFVPCLLWSKGAWQLRWLQVQIGFRRGDLMVFARRTV